MGRWVDKGMRGGGETNMVIGCFLFQRKGAKNRQGPQRSDLTYLEIDCYCKTVVDSISFFFANLCTLAALR